MSIVRIKAGFAVLVCCLSCSGAKPKVSLDYVQSRESGIRGVVRLETGCKEAGVCTFTAVQDGRVVLKWNGQDEESPIETGSFGFDVPPGSYHFRVEGKASEPGKSIHCPQGDVVVLAEKKAVLDVRCTK